MEIRHPPGYLAPASSSHAGQTPLRGEKKPELEAQPPAAGGLEPTESFTPQGDSGPVTLPVSIPSQTPPNAPAAPQANAPLLSWQDGDIINSCQGNGPITSLPANPENGGRQLVSLGRGLTLAQVLATIKVEPEASAAPAMQEREAGYLGRFPFREDEKALKTRAQLNERYHDPSTSAQSMTETLTRYAQQRGLELTKAPPELVGDFSASNLEQVKAAAQGMVDKLFLSSQTSHNPEKHATVSQETARFLDLAAQVARPGFTAADAYRLVAGNLALISYQDKAAAENMLGDHGVRHLLGHNIKACEELADGLEKRGIPVVPMDRLVMHQAMIVHDLGYAMDSVRDSINSEGLKGQDAGHNVLAARYLRERSQDPDDPLAKLFGQRDLERMHRCVLYHDKDVNGGPGVRFQMTSHPTEEDRAVNLETMTRVADNSHAFEDKLPELLYRKPQSLKAMRMMKTAGEIGDQALVETLKGDLAQRIAQDSSLAKDDREALLQSVSSVTANSYQFSVGRIAASKPRFDIDESGRVELSVEESGTHQQTSALFGMETYRQMEKFVKDCSGQKVKLNGQDEVIEGEDVCVIVRGPSLLPADEFNTELTRGLLQDTAFVKYALMDAQLAQYQITLEERQELGAQDVAQAVEEIKDQRRQVLEKYRAGVAVG
jgi:hypothetical protein